MCENLKILVYIYMVQQHFVVCTEVSSGRDGGIQAHSVIVNLSVIFFIFCLVSVWFSIFVIWRRSRYYQNLSQTLSATDT